MSYQPERGAPGLNDFAAEILGADDGDNATEAARIIAAAIYRVGAQVVDGLDSTRRALNKVSEHLEFISVNLPDSN